jgi:hypothetical protein
MLFVSVESIILLMWYLIKPNNTDLIGILKEVPPQTL